MPTPAWAERLRQAGWLLKAQADGFVLLAPSAGPAPWPTGASSPFPLLFHLQPHEASFHLCTNLPLAPDAGDVHYRGRYHRALKQAVPPAGTTACFRARKAVRLAQHYTLPPLHLAVYQPDAEDKKKLRIIARQLPYGQITGLKEVNIKNERCYVAEIFL